MPKADYGGKKVETVYWIRWEDFSISAGSVDLEETRKIAEEEAIEKGMNYIII